MKKLIAGSSMILLFMVFTSHAQTTANNGRTVRLSEGPNSIALPGGNTLNFDFRNNAFSNFSFIDATGASYGLTASTGVVAGTTAPDCGSGQTRESYLSSAMTVGVSICVPPLTGSNNKMIYNTTIDMPKGGSANPTGKALNRRVEVKLSK